MTSSLVVFLDIAGSFAFALSGALTAVRRRLDLFGVMVLAYASATAGGMLRDLLLGATPPAALADWRYACIALLAGVVGFYRQDQVERLQHPVQLLDAAGLGLFAVLGTGKALAAGLGPMGAMMLGVLTGVGGGIARDVLVAQVPQVLQRELYAMAALAGAAVVVVGHELGLPSAGFSLSGAVLCFALRWLAIERGWRLPVARPNHRDGDSVS